MSWIREFCGRWAIRPGRTVVRLRAALHAREPLASILHAEYRWRKTRNAYIAEHGECAMCKAAKDLEVHHVRPWHLYPELRYAFENLITLCDCCHFRFGHGRNWKKWNPDVRALCAAAQPLLADIRAE